LAKHPISSEIIENVIVTGDIKCLEKTQIQNQAAKRKSLQRKVSEITKHFSCIFCPFVLA